MLFGAGVLATYALWIVCAAASFWVVRLDNLMFLLGSIFDVVRWPVQVFQGVWRIVFTFVIPVAVMTTFPAMALLSRLGGRPDARHRRRRPAATRAQPGGLAHGDPELHQRI